MCFHMSSIFELINECYLLSNAGFHFAFGSFDVFSSEASYSYYLLIMLHKFLFGLCEFFENQIDWH